MPEINDSTAKTDSFGISKTIKVEPIGLQAGTVNPAATMSEGKPPISCLFVQVPLEVLESNISPSALKLYLMLLKYARQAQECWPSHQTLARNMSLKPRRIANLLKELDEAGLVTVGSRAREGQSNLYRLHKAVRKDVDKSPTALPETTYPLVENCQPGKQQNAGEGKQIFANESYALELHSSKNYNHTIQSSECYKSQSEINGNKQTSVNVTVRMSASENGKQGQARHIRPISAPTPASYHPQSLQKTPEPAGIIKDRVAAALTAYGVAQFRARQLAPAVTAANLDEKYIYELAEWIKNQATLRKIYNPAGLMVQMVYQLAPLPVSTGYFSHPQNAESNNISHSNNNNQLELNQSQEVVAKHLPRLIEIEQRNLEEASCERDRTAARSKLDKLLALQELSRFNTHIQATKATATSTGTSDSYPRYVQTESVLGTKQVLQ